jgi:hypothetical protein
MIPETGRESNATRMWFYVGNVGKYRGKNSSRRGEPVLPVPLAVSGRQKPCGERKRKNDLILTKRAGGFPGKRGQNGGKNRRNSGGTAEEISKITGQIGRGKLNKTPRCNL